MKLKLYEFVPCFSNRNQYKYFPWFVYNDNAAGFVCANTNATASSASANVGSRLCLKSEELATYCDMHFIQLWADFNLIRKAQEVADSKTVTAVDKAAAAIAQATGAAPANVDPETGENKEDKKQAKTTTKK